MIRRRPRAGFTLLELTIVLLVSSMVFLIGAGLQSHYSRTTQDLRDASSTIRELRLGIEWLRKDAGGAVDFQRLGRSRVRIFRSDEAMRFIGGVAPDSGVEYRLVDDRLFRRDLEVGGNFVVAEGLETFEVRAAGTEVRLQLGAGEGAHAQALELRWSP